MADTFTVNYSFTQPEVGASQDTWGGKLNDNWADVDALIKALNDTNLIAGAGLTGGGDLSATSRTFALTGQALALHEFTGSGLMVRTGSASYVARTIQGGDGVNLSDGDGVSGNPSVAVDSTVVRTSGDQTIGGQKTLTNMLLLNNGSFENHLEMERSGHGGMRVTPSGSRILFRPTKGAENFEFEGGVVADSYGGNGVTQSPTDTTAGRVTKTGDGGLLLGPGSTLALNDLHDANVSGVYRTTGGTANLPSGVTGSWGVWSARAGSTTAGVILFDGSTLHSLRLTDAGEVSNVETYYNTGNLVGTVSQSGGDPTGAVIERGSNSNGEYVRFADGTQICSHTINVGSGISNGSGTWEDPYRTSFVSPAHPAEFASSPTVAIVASAEDAPFNQRFNSVGYNFISPTIISGLRIARIGDGTSTEDVIAQIITFGRWF